MRKRGRERIVMVKEEEKDEEEETGRKSER